MAAIATTDLTEYAKNNLKRFEHAAVCTVKGTMSGGTTLEAATKYTIGVIPPRSIIFGTSVVVKTAFNGTTPAALIELNDADIVAAADLTSPGIIVSAITAPVYTGEASMLVYYTPTAGDSTEGDIQTVVSYVELDATTGMYASEQ